jgi:hypothetical protein
LFIGSSPFQIFDFDRNQSVVFKNLTALFVVELHEKALTKIDFSAKIWNFALKPLPRFVFENKKRTLSAHPFIACV